MNPDEMATYDLYKERLISRETMWKTSLNGWMIGSSPTPPQFTSVEDAQRWLDSRQAVAEMPWVG